MTYDKSRLIQCRNHISHREGLARAGNSKECLELIAFLKAFYKLLNRLWLVSGRLVFAMKLKD